MRGKPLIIGMFLLVPALVVLIFHKVINDFHNRTQGVFAAFALLVAIYSWVWQFYYLKNERFHLWVQRQFLRLRRVHTYWRFTVRYSNLDHLFIEGRSRLPDLQQEVLAAFRTAYPGKPVMHTSAKNSLLVVVDDIDRFDFSFDVERNEVSLQTSKMRVPSNIYDAFLDTLMHVFNLAEKAIRPRETAYRLELAFDRNPYFGFFVRHVPARLLNYFKCSFQSTISADCRVEATKDTIYLDCPSNVTLGNVARGYLSLSDRLLTQGKAG